MLDADTPVGTADSEQEPQSSLMHLDDDNVEEIMLASKIRGMSRTRKITVILAALIFVALGAFGYYRWSASKADSDYLTMAVSNTTITDSIEATGTLEPVKKSEMGFKNDGTITAINVNPGDQVIQGQVLAQQEPTSLTSALEQAQNTVDQDIINVKTCNLAYQSQLRNFEQQQKLQEAGAVAQSDMDTARDDLTRAELELATAQSKLANDQIKAQQARSDLSEATLIAPFDGIIGAVNGQVGQINGINSSTSTLLTVMSEDLQLTALVNEADIGQVKSGQEVEFTSTTYSNKTFSGKVVRITPEAQTVSNVQYYPVLISCSDPDRLLKSGMTVSAEIIISCKANVLTVPKMAVTYAQTYMQQNAASSGTKSTTGSGSTNKSQSNSAANRSSIKALNKNSSGPSAGFSGLDSTQGRPGMVLVLQNNKPVLKTVRLGLSDESNYEVVSGLEAGDQVVVGTSQSASSDSSTSNNSNSSNRSKGNMGGGMGGPPPGM
ncbi:MAG: efflux RND transporter periplasmic adaptor subunit [Syntrophomonadaceae bacterium]|nr:efflux RND transporter periplasmic adaptor subunit [Syntrophomonadaceae bacterium]